MMLNNSRLEIIVLLLDIRYLIIYKSFIKRRQYLRMYNAELFSEY